MSSLQERLRVCGRCVSSVGPLESWGPRRCPADGSEIVESCRQNRCPRGLFTTHQWTPQTDVETIRAGLFGECVPYQPRWTQWPNVREAFRREMARRRTTEMLRCGGRGIVIAGGGAYFASVVVTVRMLRHVGCRLPIEVWYLGDRAEMLPWQVRLLQALGVSCIDADALARERGTRIPGGWELKPFAVMGSRFAEVCYLDADCYPARDPSHLFESPTYQLFGALYWPDRPRYSLAPEAWEAVGLADRDEPDFETGAFLVDKRRAWPALTLAHWMCQRSHYYFGVGPREPLDVSPGRWAQGIFGDKSVFHLAHRLTDVAYALAPRSYEWIPPALLHFDLDGRTPLFVHRARCKFSLTPDLLHTSLQHGPEYEPSLPMEEEAQRFFSELREMMPTHDHATIFSAIYTEDVWKQASGPGSSEAATQDYRRILAQVLRQLRVKSVADLGCGDWRGTRLIDWTGIDYLGLDVVPSLIDANRRLYARPGVRFELADLSACEPPPADLLICKDLLQHWTDEEVAAFLARARGRTMLLTNAISGQESPIETGGFRPLHLADPKWGIEDLQAIATFDETSTDTKQILLAGAKSRITVR